MAYLQSHDRSVIDGFTAEQRLFVGWAQVWYSSNRYRVNGPLSNMPEFAQAFSCKADSPMVRQNACRVW